MNKIHYLQKIKAILLLFILNFPIILSAQSTELFSSEVTGATNFSDNSETYNLSSNLSIEFGSGYGHTGDDRFIGTGANPPGGPGVIGSITNNSNNFYVHSLWIYPSSDGGNNPTNNGTVIFKGKLNGSTVFTQTVSSGFSTNYADADYGFSKVSFTSYNTIAIDELEVEITGSFNYLAIDDFEHERAISCINPQIPTVTVSPTSVCNGSSTTLYISGNLNDATNWHIYTGSCGGTLIGTTSTGSFSVTPSSPSTTYFVRGEGGCVTPGSCGSVTVMVNANTTIDVQPTTTTNMCQRDPSIELSVSASGSGTLSYQWYNLTGAISGAQSSTLQIATQTGNSNTYYCKVTATCGSATSNNAVVNINPSYNQTKYVSVCSGESFTFPDGTTQNNITSQVIYTSNLSTVNTSCDSIITTTVNVNPVYNLNESVSVCSGESFTFPDGTTQNNITSQVIYTSNLSTVNTSCDSIITTTVNITEVNIQTSSTNASIIAEANNAIYQWIDCNNSNQPIQNEKEKEFFPSQNGSYAVEITIDGCKEISSCETFTTVDAKYSIKKTNPIIYPNPTTDIVTIKFNSSNDTIFIKLYNEAGNLISNMKTEKAESVDIAIEGVEGLYFIEISDKYGNTNTYQIIKK